MLIKPLNEEAIKQAGWNDTYISGYSERVHIFYYHAEAASKNIIVLHTPVIAVKNCYECYEQLGSIYGFNVFAVDYVPDEGECSGTTKDFTLPNMVANLDAVYEYVSGKYSGDIHLLGYTGIGGIMAQYYLGTGCKFKSFAQFACGIYGDIAPLGLPKFLAKPLIQVCRLLIRIKPTLAITFTPPPAKGYHAELDNEFYKSFRLRDANFFIMKINTLLRMLECMVGKESLLKVPLACPTLVFKTLHDRYFSCDYFDQYFDALTCEKKLVEINDVHNSYFISPEPFMKEIAAWVNSH
ncbi:hypothetical protein [Robinsoniella peoriensis]|uniref:hypothetical protein n=1 Tax=Robinsoniella peoriensis TaxID=180332 RepID=UPI00362EEB70